MYTLPYRLISVLDLPSSGHDQNVSSSKLTRKSFKLYRPKAEFTLNLESLQTATGTVQDNRKPGWTSHKAKDSISVSKTYKISMLLKWKWWDLSSMWKQLKMCAWSSQWLDSSENLVRSTRASEGHKPLHSSSRFSLSWAQSYGCWL